MTRKEMLGLAAQHMRAFSPQSSAYGDNRSLFGMLRALIACAEESDLGGCLREAMKVRQYKFYGVKRQELQNAFRTLLPVEMLTRFSCKDEAIAYLEICYRIFISNSASQMSLDSNMTEAPVFDQSADDKMDYGGLDMFKLQLNLVKGDMECAAYILAHPEKFTDKKLIAKAREVERGTV